jgi:pyruvate/2-oxoglutarate dehydrogenase complex dihydrolipoamide dehydrogenase (E3) component
VNRLERADEAASLGPLEPLDEHNRRLQENVHPPAWTNPEPKGRYNMVVVGAGTAGLVTAVGSASLGARVALVERALMGGDCLNVGCVPSKALIRCARAAAETRRGEAYGVRVPGPVEVDFPAVMERMRRLRAGISPHDSAKRFRDLGVDVYLGRGRFVGPDRLEVGPATLTFARACIATGARAAAPPVPGLEDSGYLTNETVFSLTELPGRLAVIGAGPIGCELAQSFARFGAEVHLVEIADQILVREDRDAAAIVARQLGADGVSMHLGTRIMNVERTERGKRISLEDATEALEVDEILVAVGRAPNVDDLGLEAAGVEHTRNGVTVDDRLRTTNRRIFAAGDVCFPYKFTHVADFMARIVIQNALFFGRTRASGLVVPWCTYTDPEVAHVGLSVSQARKRGLEVETIRIELTDVDRALLDGEDEGFLKVHVRKGTDRILGATFVASHAGEMISQLTAAIRNGLGLGAMARTIHPYPTQADAIRKAGDAYNRTRLTPTVKKVFGMLMAWRR